MGIKLIVIFYCSALLKAFTPGLVKDSSAVNRILDSLDEVEAEFSHYTAGWAGIEPGSCVAAWPRPWRAAFCWPLPPACAA